jgi:hypothetical protein
VDKTFSLPVEVALAALFAVVMAASMRRTGSAEARREWSVRVSLTPCIALKQPKRRPWSSCADVGRPWRQKIQWSEFHYRTGERAGVEY